MTKHLASLYAQRALNERVFEQGRISKQLYLAVNEALRAEIDRAWASPEGIPGNVENGSACNGATGAAATAG